MNAAQIIPEAVRRIEIEEGLADNSIEIGNERIVPSNIEIKSYYFKITINLHFYFTDIVEICIICYDNEVSVTLIPCGHIFCNTCVLRLTQEREVRCPFCRVQPDNYVGLVLDNLA